MRWRRTEGGSARPLESLFGTDCQWFYFLISQICPRIFSCVLLDMCSIHMYCEGRCTDVRELLEVRLSVTPISESISEGDKRGRWHIWVDKSLRFPQSYELYCQGCHGCTDRLASSYVDYLLNHLWVHWRWSGWAPWWSARRRCWPPPRCSACTAPRSWEMKIMWMVLVVMTMLKVTAMRSDLGPLLGYEHWCW